MKIKILSVAENDIEEGYRFYESQHQGFFHLILTLFAKD